VICPQVAVAIAVPSEAGAALMAVVGSFEAGARSGSPYRRISYASFAVVAEHQKDSSFFKHSRLSLSDLAPRSFADVNLGAFAVTEQASRPGKV